MCVHPEAVCTVMHTLFKTTQRKLMEEMNYVSKRSARLHSQVTKDWESPFMPSWRKKKNPHTYVQIDSVITGEEKWDGSRPVVKKLRPFLCHTDLFLSHFLMCTNWIGVTAHVCENTFLCLSLPLLISVWCVNSPVVRWRRCVRRINRKVHLLSARCVRFNRVGNETTGEYAVDPKKYLNTYATLSKRMHKMLWQ